MALTLTMLTLGRQYQSASSNYLVSRDTESAMRGGDVASTTRLVQVELRQSGDSGQPSAYPRY